MQVRDDALAAADAAAARAADADAQVPYLITTHPLSKFYLALT
jgi:hypothetical protein